jgi:predicted HAD superfamily Cof-like phosphohydrolase
MIDEITLWHERARPEVTQRSFDVQLGCHIEEFIEMIDALGINWEDNEYLASTMDILDEFSAKLKSGAETVPSMNREALLDALADQIVTAVGVGVCAKMDMVAAVQEVNASNWSKFDYKGFPEFDENGKIKKGDKYRQPNLKGMY